MINFLHLYAVTWSDDTVGFAEHPTLTGVAVDLGITTSLLALLALESAALGQMGVLVAWIAGFTFPQFGSITRVLEFGTSALTWSLNKYIVFFSEVLNHFSFYCLYM